MKCYCKKHNKIVSEKDFSECYDCVTGNYEYIDKCKTNKFIREKLGVDSMSPVTHQREMKIIVNKSQRDLKLKRILK